MHLPSEATEDLLTSLGLEPGATSSRWPAYPRSYQRWSRGNEELMVPSLPTITREIWWDITQGVGPRTQRSLRAGFDLEVSSGKWG